MEIVASKLGDTRPIPPIDPYSLLSGMQTRAQGGYVDQRRKGTLGRRCKDGDYASGSLGAPRTDKCYHSFRITPRIAPRIMRIPITQSITHAQAPSLAPFVTCVTDD